MKVIRNVLISVASSVVVAAFFTPYAIICIPLFNVNDSGITLDIFIASYIFFAFLVIFLVGLLLIKPTGKIKNDFLSVGILGIVLFVLFVVISFFATFFDKETYSQLFLSTKEVKYLFLLTAELAVMFIVCFIPSLCLWLGMFSRKENRTIIKETIADAKLKKGKLPKENENTK